MTNAISSVARNLQLIALTAAIAGAQTPAQPAVNEFVAGGIRVIHKQVTANDVIAARLFLIGGAAALTPETEGIEALIAQTITKGTIKYDKDAFSALATSTGTQVGGAPDLDYTAFFVQGVRQNFNDSWDLFTQAVLHPTFPPDEVEQARAQIINNLRQRADNPDNYLNLIADSLLYAGHPYDANTEGNPASVAKLTRDDLAAWHKRRMTKANLLLVVVGNISRAELTSKVAAAFAGLPAAGGAARPVPALASRPSTLSLVERPMPTNYIIGQFPLPGRASPDYPATRVAMRVLGERLFEEVRTKRNLTYAVAAGVVPARQSKGNLYVTAVEPDTTIKVIFSEVKKIQREPVSLPRLRETINVYTTGYWQGQETNMGQAIALGDWEITGGGWRNSRLFVTRIAAVTPAEIQRVAAKYLKNARFVVIGDPKKVNPSLFTSF